MLIVPIPVFQVATSVPTYSVTAVALLEPIWEWWGWHVEHPSSLPSGVLTV
jgi:hypothetical protein